MTYKMTYRNGKNIREHRAIMQDYLGRELLPIELVHHKDGNKRNNDISNLEITTRSEHLVLHKEVREAQKKATKKYNIPYADVCELFVNRGLAAHRVSQSLGIPLSSINNFIRVNGIKHRPVYCESCGVLLKQSARLCKRCYARQYWHIWRARQC